VVHDERMKRPPRAADRGRVTAAAVVAAVVLAVAGPAAGTAYDRPGTVFAGTLSSAVAIGVVAVVGAIVTLAVPGNRVGWLMLAAAAVLGVGTAFTEAGIHATARGGQLPAVEDVRRRLGLGLDPAQPGVTVAAWLDSWLAGKRRTKRASTVRGYESHIRVHINPVIGDLPLERLNVGHVEAVLAAVPGSAGTRHRGAERRGEAAPDHLEPMHRDRTGAREPGRGAAVDPRRGGPVPCLRGG
jgi:hypothetical protein